MFGKRRRREGVAPASEATTPDVESLGGLPVPKHVGDVWQIVQKIAVEEDPSFADRNVIQYYHQGVEAQKDIVRWLAIYQRRCDASHEFEFASHHPRYRGHVLVPRVWPSGLRWEAFDESTWMRTPLPACREREQLEKGLDRLLEGSE